MKRKRKRNRRTDVVQSLNDFISATGLSVEQLDGTLKLQN